MISQIEQALKRWDTTSLQNQEKIRGILKRYLEEAIKLDEAYSELLDEDLIPMPQRCGMHSHAGEDEGRLRKSIKEKLSL
jgi:hypothetical protein